MQQDCEELSHFDCMQNSAIKCPEMVSLLIQSVQPDTIIGLLKVPCIVSGSKVDMTLVDNSTLLEDAS